MPKFDRNAVNNYVNALPPNLRIATTASDPKNTTPTACDVAQCSPAKMYELIGMKVVRSVKMDGRRLVDTASLLEYLNDLPEDDILPPKRKRIAAQNGQEARVQPLASEAARSSRGVDKRTGKAGRRRVEASAGA
jgi:hypothetical protein